MSLPSLVRDRESCDGGERRCRRQSRSRRRTESRVGRPLIALKRVKKVYRTGRPEYPALRGVDLEIESGDHGRDRRPIGQWQVDDHERDCSPGSTDPTSGAVTVDEQRIDLMSEEELAIWRGKRVGVVFQFFQLLPTLTALENAMLPLDFSRRVPKRERAELGRRNLELVGLGGQGQSCAGGTVGRRAAARCDRAGAGGRSAAA